MFYIVTVKELLYKDQGGCLQPLACVGCSCTFVICDFVAVRCKAVLLQSKWAFFFNCDMGLEPAPWREPI